MQRSTATGRISRQAQIPHVLKFGAANTDDVIIENSAGEVTDNLGDNTYEVNVCPTQLQGADKYLFAIPASAGANRRYLTLNAVNLLGAVGGGTVGSTFRTLRIGEWVKIHLLVNSVAQTYRIKVDGVEVLAPTAFTMGTGNADITIGNLNASSTSAFIGRMGETLMWNRLLTDAEIDQRNLEIPVTDGLIAHWNRLSDDGTQLLDSVSGNHGAITGATRVTTIGSLPAMPRQVRVPYVGALSFDGVDDVVTFSPITLLPKTGKCSASFRVKIPKGAATLALLGDTLTTNRFVLVEADGTILMEGNTNNDRFETNAGAFNNSYSREAHIVIVSDLGVGKVYLDGMLLPMADASIGSDITLSKIGLSETINPLKGLVYSVRLLNGVALTTEEVEQLYITNTTPYDNDPTICKLNLETTAGQISGDGTTWYDKSGNGNSGTISGAVLV